MPTHPKKIFRKLSNGDPAKDVLKLPKMILEGQCLWPGRDNLLIKIVNWFMFFNMLIIHFGNVLYLVYNIGDVSKVAKSFTTISATFQICFKIFTLRHYKKNLNDILCIILDDFWPVEIASKNTQKTIQRDILFVKIFGYTCVVAFFLSCSLFMYYPLVKGDMNLPVELPFSCNQVAVYEILVIWQSFSNLLAIFIMAGYDILFCCLVINCMAQFKIIQDVLKNLYNTDDGNLRKKIFSQLGITTDMTTEETKQRLLFIKCTNHHVKVIEVCEKLEHAFSLIMFLQFVESTMALCVSCFVMIAIQTEYYMAVYVFAHLLELFMYCAMGTQLIYESQQVAVAAFESGWHTHPDKNMGYGVIMVIQRAQKEIKLTALGFVELSYRSFLMVLRLSFSVYTMLSNIKNKREN